MNFLSMEDYVSNSQLMGGSKARWQPKGVPMISPHRHTKLSSCFRTTSYVWRKLGERFEALIYCNSRPLQGSGNPGLPLLISLIAQKPEVARAWKRQPQRGMYALRRGQCGWQQLDHKSLARDKPMKRNNGLQESKPRLFPERLQRMEPASFLQNTAL